MSALEKGDWDAPLYARLARALEEQIDQGVFPPDRRLPGVRRLAVRFRLSASTVVKALEMLEAAGVVEARARSGFYIRPARRVSWRSQPIESRNRPTAVTGQERVLELLQGAQRPGVLSLAGAMPDAGSLPTRMLASALSASARRRGPADAAYDFPPGYLPLRQVIAERMLAAGCMASPEDIVITSGCQEAVTMSLRAVTRPGDVVAVESPTYYGLLQAIEAAGLRALEIPGHPETGISIEALQLAAESWPIRACAVVPSYSNPTGSSMPEARRAALAALARRFGFAIIEDDVYGDLGHGGVRPRPVKAHDRDGSIFYCSSFSKTIAPDLRVGWVCARQHTQRLTYLKFASNLAAPGLQQRALSVLLGRGGYERHLRQVRRHHAATMARFIAAIDRYFPEGTQVTRPAGGYVLWVQLPDAAGDAGTLAQLADQAGISIAPGTLFSPTGKHANCFRLNCSMPWSERLDAALGTLGHLARSGLDGR